MPPSGSARRDRGDGPAATEQVKYGRLSDDDQKDTFAGNLAAFDGYIPPDAKVQGMDMEGVDEWRHGVHPCPPIHPHEGAYQGWVSPGATALLYTLVGFWVHIGAPQRGKVGPALRPSVALFYGSPCYFVSQSEVCARL
ncbi:uncharacterized protein PG986_000069 [Apiospora aurea]|uniref:Uncharacterized protein n=1 Tax=Apiospora aurea TaxID=335848 RepID=A0ABR1QTD3_9PEZI